MAMILTHQSIPRDVDSIPDLYNLFLPLLLIPEL
jgi:hypothetical protein